IRSAPRAAARPARSRRRPRSSALRSMRCMRSAFAISTCRSRRNNCGGGSEKPIRTLNQIEPDMRTLDLGLTLVLVAGILEAATARAEPVTIRAAWIAPATNWASILLEKKDLATHLGQSYVLAPERYAGTPQMVTALANNELEVANLAYS